jgi:hypothetical protein
MNRSLESSPDRSNLIHPENIPYSSRRDFLIRHGLGFGAVGMAAMYGINPFDLQAAAPQASVGGNPSVTPKGPLAPKKPHFTAKAKAVIHIFAPGAPSSVDTWDPKPLLNKHDGKNIPGYQGIAFGSPFKFQKQGKSGIEVSEVFPQIGKHIDDLVVVRSLFAEIPEHVIAGSMMNTGSPQLPKPSIGSWALYGLGSENQNMPGFITLGGEPEWRQCSFMPGIYQGCNVNYSPTQPLSSILANIRSQFSSLDRQKRQLEMASMLNKMHAEKLQRDLQLEARIEAFEIAFKMQTEATDAFDVSKETQATRDMYEKLPGSTTKNAHGTKLLVARRLIERGVRFVQVPIGDWDHHNDIETALPLIANSTDGAVAALLTDLKQRGLLDSTLVIWGGEFSRTVTRDGQGGGAKPGRDHNGQTLCCWMAGGGVKAGTVYGATDEFGGRSVENRMHIHDLHATWLHLLGFDHTKLTYDYNGRSFRLTDNFGEVAKDLIA